MPKVVGDVAVELAASIGVTGGLILGREHVDAFKVPLDVKSKGSWPDV